MLSILPQLLDFQFYGPFILRLALGVIFLAHGWPKLKGDKSQFAGWLESMNLRPGKFWAWVVALAEFLGGILILAGLFTQLAAFVLAIEFFVIIFWVRRGQPFVLSEGRGREFDFLILAALLSLLVLGPGAFAVDYPL
ncbi:MAG: DoxX family protein [Candidatus Giovannonibacteria bacterium GW2011_GWA2_44_13b]|uniref:DoxX family protein n=1 Tax=Candidatus Giovannonibacteria bacterium GW2011_GWA2_44_13b TaxID=1618647 RepID=A0A0G1J7A0_9BACT|nr:MAG: DoxX family protein [Candidatus Giovannonibacteria bacterium GW2011_GWA2_44_13b]